MPSNPGHKWRFASGLRVIEPNARNRFSTVGVNQTSRDYSNDIRRRIGSTKAMCFQSKSQGPNRGNDFREDN